MTGQNNRTHRLKLSHCVSKHSIPNQTLISAQEDRFSGQEGDRVGIQSQVLEEESVIVINA